MGLRRWIFVWRRIMKSEPAEEIFALIEAPTQASPTAMEFEMAYQARTLGQAVDRTASRRAGTIAAVRGTSSTTGGRFSKLNFRSMAAGSKDLSASWSVTCIRDPPSAAPSFSDRTTRPPKSLLVRTTPETGCNNGLVSEHYSGPVSSPKWRSTVPISRRKRTSC